MYDAFIEKIIMATRPVLASVSRWWKAGGVYTDFPDRLNWLYSMIDDMLSFTARFGKLVKRDLFPSWNPSSYSWFDPLSLKYRGYADVWEEDHKSDFEDVYGYEIPQSEVPKQEQASYFEPVPASVLETKIISRRGNNLAGINLKKFDSVISNLSKRPGVLRFLTGIPVAKQDENDTEIVRVDKANSFKFDRILKTALPNMFARENQIGGHNDLLADLNIRRQEFITDRYADPYVLSPYKYVWKSTFIEPEPDRRDFMRIVLTKANIPDRNINESQPYPDFIQSKGPEISDGFEAALTDILPAGLKTNVKKQFQLDMAQIREFNNETPASRFVVEAEQNSVFEFKNNGSIHEAGDKIEKDDPPTEPVSASYLNTGLQQHQKFNRYGAMAADIDSESDLAAESYEQKGADLQSNIIPSRSGIADLAAQLAGIVAPTGEFSGGDSRLSHLSLSLAPITRPQQTGGEGQSDSSKSSGETTSAQSSEDTLENDPEQMASEVYEILKRRLIVDRERSQGIN